LRVYVHKNVKLFLDSHPDLFKDIENPLEIIIDNNIELDKFKIFSAKSNKDITSEYNSCTSKTPKKDFCFFVLIFMII